MFFNESDAQALDYVLCSDLNYAVLPESIYAFCSDHVDEAAPQASIVGDHHFLDFPHFHPHTESYSLHTEHQL